MKIIVAFSEREKRKRLIHYGDCFIELVPGLFPFILSDSWVSIDHWQFDDLT